MRSGTWSWAVGMVALVGCGAAAHVPPPDDAPQATVGIRLVYHAAPASDLRQEVRLDGRRVDVPANPRPFYREVRVAPAPMSVSIASDFWREPIRRMDGTSFSPRVATACTKRAPCGAGRPAGRFEPVTVRERVAGCAASVDIAPEPTGRYLIHYDFYGTDRCSARCYRSVSDGRGGTVLAACDGGSETSPAPEDRPAVPSGYDG